ncbi:unnamed protein product, partial [Prorocentrum cordatum]
MKSSSIAVLLFLVGCVGAAQLKVIDDATDESGAARSPVYGYEITYKSTHQIDDIYFVKNGARTIPFMESFPTYGGCTLTQGGPCNGGHQSPWDSSGKADNSGCWSFTTHSILCDHDITSDEVHIEFWSGGYSSTSGLTVKSLDAGGSVIATVADVGSRSGLTACNALDGAGTPTICPVSPPTTYTQPTAATPSPTAATPSPTSAPSPAASVASAVGDPHLQNVHGERFDLMKEGNHVLISIPRGQIAENALLRVRADARRLGGQCADMYFQALNVTGSWAEASQAGGYRMAFGPFRHRALFVGQRPLRPPLGPSGPETVAREDAWRALGAPGDFELSRMEDRGSGDRAGDPRTFEAVPRTDAVADPIP